MQEDNQDDFKENSITRRNHAWWGSMIDSEYL
jgi:hypothetical protein